MATTEATDQRTRWIAAVVLCWVVGFGTAFALSPGHGAPGRSLRTLLVLCASGHVAATAWFGSVPSVRAHARQHPRRYLIAPLALVLGSAAAVLLLSQEQVSYALLGFFGWQFVHFQKQNLGLAALAAAAYGAGPLRPPERRALLATALAGTAGLLAHPELLQLPIDPHLRWLFRVAEVAYAVAVAAGLLWLRTRQSRPPQLVAVYALGLVFFTPVFVFASPYAAVAGLVLAHGLQYLLLMGCVASRPVGDVSGAISAAVLVNLVLIGGIAVNAVSHQHGAAGASRVLFGVYLGVVMTHFVVDAGLWRLRDPFPRELLVPRLPYLLR